MNDILENTSCPACSNIFNPKTSWGIKKFCSNSCAAKFRNKERGPRSQETKNKISNWAKNNPRGFVADPTKSGLGWKSPGISGKKSKSKLICTICAECGNTFTYRYASSNRKYCSVSCTNKNKYHPNSNKVHRKVYNGIQLDSGGEYNFVILLEKYNIKWIKNKHISFPFIKSDGKKSNYWPDFYLPDYNFWVEIKGKRYIRPDDELRRKAVGNNIELIMSHEIRLPKCIKITNVNLIWSGDSGRFESS